MTRPRRVPDWPESLKLPEPSRPPLAVAGGGVPMLSIEEAIALGDPRRVPITAIALGTLQHGRHAAIELTIQGREVTGAVLLLAMSEVDTPAETFREAAYLRLFARRDFTAYEAPARHPLDLEQLRDGSAIALPTWKGKPAALAFDFEGRTVTEPKVVATGDRTYAWGALETWAACNILPRGRR